MSLSCSLGSSMRSVHRVVSSPLSSILVRSSCSSSSNSCSSGGGSCRSSSSPRAVAGPGFPGPVTTHWASPRLASGLTQFSDVVAVRASGSWVYDKDERAFLDFACGIGVTNLGHCHPRVNAAAHAQLDLGVHLQVNCVTSPPMIRLAEKLGALLPPGFDKNYQVLFSNSGAESIENAVKLARVATKRQTVIVFQGGFHGRTIATGALTTAKYVYRAGFQPSMSGVHVVPFPYCHRCKIKQANKDACCNDSCCCNNSLDELRNCLKQQTSPDEVAAILIEPMLGEGGYVVPPPKFLQQLQQVANEIGAVFIADEVQTGFGRTGSYFAVEQFGAVPDIIVCAKGIANGLPLSAIITSASLLSKAKPGSIGGTYTGNAVACAAACAVVDELTDPKVKLLENVNARGEQFRAGLTRLQSKYPIGDVRGRGLFNAIEFLDSAGAGVAAKLVKEGVKEGLLLLNCGLYDTIRFIPPLNISKEEVDIALEKLDKALARVFAK